MGIFVYVTRTAAVRGLMVCKELGTAIVSVTNTGNRSPQKARPSPQGVPSVAEPCLPGGEQLCLDLP